MVCTCGAATPGTQGTLVSEKDKQKYLSPRDEPLANANTGFDIPSHAMALTVL